MIAGRPRVAEQERQTPPIPPVLLNHLYVVVDSETLTAILASPLITQQLESLETRTTTANGGQMWTGHRSEEHTSELQSQSNLVCRLLLEKKKKKKQTLTTDNT